MSSELDAAGPRARTAAGVTLVFLLFPLAMVVLMSVNASRYLEFPPARLSAQWYSQVLGDPAWRASALLSVEVATMTSVAATVLAALAALVVVELPSRLQRAVLGIAVLPMVIPAIVMAVGLHMVFAKCGLLESRAGLVIAHTCLAMPVALLSVISSLQTVDTTLPQAARTLGATWAESTIRVVLPLAKPGIAAGALLAFVTSFDEPVIAAYVAGTSLVTLPKRMWDVVQFEIDPSAAAVSAMLVVIAAAVVLLSARLYARLPGRGRLDRSPLDPV